MADELVAVQIEVHPPGVTATLRATQHLLVEVPRLLDIPDLYGNVKRR
jgi:hypothetical protein